MKSLMRGAEGFAPPRTNWFEANESVVKTIVDRHAKLLKLQTKKLFYQDTNYFSNTSKIHSTYTQLTSVY